MLRKNDVPDKELLKSVNQRLARTGTGLQSKVSVTVRHGTVTLSGNLQYEGQRHPIVKAANSAAGVRSVIDQMQLAAKKKF